MSAKLENLESNKVKLTVEVGPEQLEEAIQKAYLKNRGKLNMPGFRKGKAPRKLIEMEYGEGFFYDDAVNELLPAAYESAVEEHKLEVVSRPDADVEELDKTTGAVLTFEVYVKPVLALEKSQYDGIEYEETDAEVSDVEVDSLIENDREKNSRMVTVSDRGIENDDVVTLDFEGFVDGIPFEGGKAEGHKLTIGSHSFIDTFEDQLIGAETGAELDVNVTFPEEYHAPELAGKPALFKVKIGGVAYKELPEVNDELAQDVSEFDTLEEYKASIKEKLKEKKQEEAENAKESAVMRVLADSVEIDIPEPMIDSELDRMIRNIGGRLRQQGIGLEQYLAMMGQNEDDMRSGLRKDAVYNVKSRLIVEAVANNEGIVVADEELDEEFARLASIYNMELDEFKQSLSEDMTEGLAIDLKMRKAANVIVDAAVAKSANN